MWRLVGRRATVWRVCSGLGFGIGVRVGFGCGFAFAFGAGLVLLKVGVGFGATGSKRRRAGGGGGKDSLRGGWVETHRAGLVIRNRDAAHGRERR